MRRTLLATGFGLFTLALALCAGLYLEHDAFVVQFKAEEPAADRLAPDAANARGRSGTSMVELFVEEGVPARIVASWGLRPDMQCDRERLRADLPLVPKTLDQLRVVWRAKSDGVERVVGRQRLAGAPADSPAGWARVLPPFVRGAGSEVVLGAAVEPEPGAGGIISGECWSFAVAGQQTLPLRTHDVAALALVPLAFVLLLLGMWRPPATQPGEGEAPPSWRWADALVPVGLFVAFQLFGVLVPWGASDMASRLLEQVPFTVALGLGAALVAARRRSRSPLAAVGGRPAGHPAWIAAGLGFGVLLALPAFRLTGALLPVDAAAAALWVPGSVLALAAAASAAALSEEVFWRGLLFEVTASRLGRWWAVAATAVPFTAVHWVSREQHPWALGAIAVLAAALGLLRARTGSLVPCVALHAGYNLALVLLGYLAAG